MIDSSPADLSKAERTLNAIQTRISRVEKQAADRLAVKAEEATLLAQTLEEALTEMEKLVKGKQAMQEQHEVSTLHETSIKP